MLRESRLSCANGTTTKIHLDIYIYEYEYYDPFTKKYQYSETFIEAKPVNNENEYIYFTHLYDGVLIEISGYKNELNQQVSPTDSIFRDVYGWTTWVYLPGRIGDDYVFKDNTFINPSLHHTYIIDNEFSYIEQKRATLAIKYSSHYDGRCLYFNIYYPEYISENPAKIDSNGFSNVQIRFVIEFFDGEEILSDYNTYTLKQCIEQSSVTLCVPDIYDAYVDYGEAYIYKDNDTNYDYVIYEI